MASAAARHIFRGASFKVLNKSLSGCVSSTGPANLQTLVKGHALLSKSVKSRCMSQILSSLQIQTVNQFGMTPTAAASLLDKCMLSKPQALTLALIDAEVTSADESDDEEDATLYILNEMFSTLCIGVDDGHDRMPKRKNQAKGSVPKVNLERNTPPYSKRTRKKVNYKEHENDNQSDSDFETDKNFGRTPESSTEEDSDVPLNVIAQQKCLKSKNTTKCHGSKMKEQHATIDVVVGSRTGIICKPNLSEDEDSEGSEEEFSVDKNEMKKKADKPMSLEEDCSIPDTQHDKTENTNNTDLYQKSIYFQTVDSSIDPLQPCEEIVGKSELSKTEKRNILHSVSSYDNPRKIMRLNIENYKTSLSDRQVSLKSRKKKSMQDKKVTTAKQDSVKQETISSHPMDVDASSGDESEDWQDVDEAKINFSPKKKKSKKSNVKMDKEIEIKDLQISVGVNSIHKKKRTREEKMFLWIRQTIGRVQRERQLLIHKCHLLSLFAKVLRENQICNIHLLQGVLLSLVPLEFFKPIHSRWDISHLRRFLLWFQKNIPTVQEIMLFTDNETSKMKYLSRVHVFVVLLRALGFDARLVVSLQPCTSKIRQAEKLLNSPEPNATRASELTHNIEDKQQTSKDFQKSESNKKLSSARSKPSNNGKLKKSQYFSVETSGDEDNVDKKKQTAKNKKRLHKSKPATEENQKNIEGIRKYSRVSKTNSSYTEGGKTKNKGFTEDRSAKNETIQKDATLRKRHDKGKVVKTSDDDDDEDFDLASETQQARRLRTNQSIRRKENNSAGKASCERTPGHHKRNKKRELEMSSGVDTWIEVYIVSMNCWITIELTTEAINEPSKCEAVATKPLQYIVGIDNDQKVKDVTCRYAEKWLSYNRKLRVDREWWAVTLSSYTPPNDVINQTEDARLKKALLEQDFPKTISEFKDNPLYVLQRHLLKFQAIYPESAVPLGYVRSEPIYSRDCVYELHTRETWMKQARTVKVGEVAYKIVKGRPRRNTPVMERDNIKVEVFGLWQTEPYVPPPVKDGKVPKNEYGNVELFQSSMLPEGAVHLPMSNMQKIARKLKIDYAPAMMGWDFHGGWSHPVIEGIVVAKEFEDVLMDAWAKEEAELEKKEKEKREKAIYENWKTLIRGILIRHKLNAKYKFEDEERTTGSTKKTPANIKTKASSKNKRKTSVKQKDEYTDLSVSWPMNRMDGKSSLGGDGHVHIFPESSFKMHPVSNVMMKACACGLSVAIDNEEKL